VTINTPVEIKTELMDVRLDRVNINDVVLLPNDDGSVSGSKVIWGDLYDGKVELRFSDQPVLFDRRGRIVTVLRTTVTLNP
jgi:hypothetical protein